MPKTIKIGKAPGNDFVISNPTVSRNHAILTVTDDNQHALLRDLGSTNGTYVNGKRITKEENIDLSHQLQFGSETTSLKAILDRTRVTPAPPTDPNSRTIGRSSECQIKMNYDDVSKRHAILTKRSDGSIYIEDTNSSNGTYVNGERITSRKLQKGDQVTITRNHPLDWESIFPTHPQVQKHPRTKPIAAVAAAIIAIIGIGIGAYWWWNNPWDKERIYEEYNSSVCWTYIAYGYTVTVDGEDFTTQLCQAVNGECSGTDGYVYVDGNKLVPGYTQSQGTAFFISKDGKLATNLHVTRPWLFDGNLEVIRQLANKVVSLYAVNDPLLTKSEVKVEGVALAMYVIPNGLPLSNDNMVRCSEIKGHDDTDIDVAIIQTDTRSLPAKVTNIIDINNADLTEDALKEGKTIYTIGFPYGASIAISSTQELMNQIHSGSITQNRGEYEFGHDAATAGGASGSPIINDRGRLVGIHHAGMTGSTGAQGFNMGIKAKYIVNLLNQ